MDDLDRRTVDLLARTSSPAALVRAEWEERHGVRVYPDWPAAVAPRDWLVRCADPGCRRAFHAAASGAGFGWRYCCTACRSHAHYWRDPVRARRRDRARTKRPR